MSEDASEKVCRKRASTVEASLACTRQWQSEFGLSVNHAVNLCHLLLMTFTHISHPCRLVTVYINEAPILYFPCLVIWWYDISLTHCSSSVCSRPRWSSTSSVTCSRAVPRVGGDHLKSQTVDDPGVFLGWWDHAGIRLDRDVHGSWCSRVGLNTVLLCSIHSSSLPCQRCVYKVSFWGRVYQY